MTEILAAPGSLVCLVIAPGVPVEYQSVQAVLRSADSGVTWQDIGNRLYSVQALPLSSAPTPQGPRGWHPSALGRLLTSTDGGHTWQVRDTQLAAVGRWAEAYTVNLADSALF